MTNSAGTSGAYCCFDLSGVQVGVAPTPFGTGFSGASASITSVGSGWCYCKFSVTSDTGTTLKFIVEADKNTGTQALSNNYVGSAAGVAIYVWGAMLVGPTQTSNLLANLIDGSGTTWWEDYSPLAWAGVDMGSSNAATFTGAYFTPRAGNSALTYADPWLDYPIQLSGSQFNQIPATVQTSNDQTFASGVSTQDTFPNTASTPIYPNLDLNYRAFSGVAARAARIQVPYGNLSQLFFTANAGPTSARPIRPTISPAGGLYPAGSTTVTITSGTTSAAIYYTTDGTTPDNTKTLYSAPFSLTIGSATALKAVAYDASATLSSVYSAVVTSNYTSNKITPLQDIYDVNRGLLLEAHGGDMIQVGSYIYWVGQGCNMYAATSNLGTGDVRQNYGVNLYRCPSDQSNAAYLKGWTYIGQILPQPTNSGVPWSVCIRPSIAYNASNSTFVLAAHVGNNGLTTSVCALATSSGMESGWTWSNTNFDPSGVGYRDGHFYVDPSGNGYLSYVGNNAGSNQGIYITKLGSTFLTAVSTNTVIGTGTRESPILFDNGANLFLMTGLSYAYNASGDSGLLYVMASGLDPIAPTWGAPASGTRVFNSNPAGGNYLRAQASFLFKPTGKTNQYVLGCDLWMPDGSTLYSSRQAWSPITITTTTISATQPASWDIGDLT